MSESALRATLGARRGGWRRRVVDHHLLLAAVNAVLLGVFVTLPPFARARAPMSRYAIATGYLGVVLLGVTLLIGPANLLLRRRNPVSNYLRRDVGIWAAAASAAHVILGVEAYGISFVDFFVKNGRPLLGSFGLGNWAGLAALVIVTGLLAISTDRSLRELKARVWKRLQRLNYTLFALVVLHAFFYGAFEHVRSPFTRILLVTITVVFGSQMAGIWLWRRRSSRRTACDPEPMGAS